MATPTVLVHPDGDLLAKAAAARLLTRLIDAQAARGGASLALTGGGIGIALLERLAEAPALAAVDWERVEVWWSDERFLPSGDERRNETRARTALLDHVSLDPARVHPMPAADGADGADLESAARSYSAELASAGHARGQRVAPPFDVCLLGIGPDAHVASLFPRHPAQRAHGHGAVAVRDAPKPPPTRVSFTLPAIQGAREVWLLASGFDKAEAVSLALRETDPVRAPAAGARGRAGTLFLLDRSAASALP